VASEQCVSWLQKEGGKSPVVPSDADEDAQQAPRPDRPLPRRRCGPARQQSSGGSLLNSQSWVSGTG